MNKFILKSISVFCGAMLAVSCTGSFDDVNTDPDNPLAEQTPSTNILAYCERYASDNMFDEWFDLNESCGFSGQIAKWMYPQEGYYNFRPTVNNSSWRVCDYVTANLKTIIDNEDPESNMWAVATIFQCQIWQIKSDRWGNIPYWTTTEGNSNLKNQALQLENGQTLPAYDKQEYIYPDLLSRLDKAVAILEGGKAADAIGDGDVLLSANTDEWIKYGNALRLRIAARIANKDAALARTTFAAVAADGKYPTSNDENVFFQWNNEYPEPWADYYQTRKNEYGVSELMVNTLKGLSDPRLAIYATPTRAYQAYKDSLDAGLNPKYVKEPYIGYTVGLKTTATVREFSQIGNRFQNRSAVTGFSPWLRASETMFTLAYLKNMFSDITVNVTASAYDNMPCSSADDLYKAGVALSMQENEISEADYTTFAVPAFNEDNLFTQWWISLYKNGQEAWSVYRMAPTTTYLFKNNAIAPDSYYSGHNCPPMCYGYPDTERNLNTANCEVEAAAESDYFWGKQMWWDVRQGLK